MEPEDKSQSILSKPNAEVGNGQISRQAVEWLLKQMIDIPKSWLIISTIFIILSTIQVSVGKENSFKFQVNNTTAVFLALTWLPSVLKIFALSGGAVKTPAGEITGSGTISMLRSLDPDSLGFLIEQTKLAEDVAPPQQQLELRQIRHQWQKAYASKVPLSETHELMERLAQRYKIIRNSAPSGAQRTFEMESIAGRMRALAPDVNLPVNEVKDLLQSQDEGKRLLGLSIVEWSGDAIYFDSVLNLITDSKTAFEQTVALRAVEKMVSKLDAQQKKDLEAALIEQRNYNPEEKRWIKPDSNRWIISDRILSALQT